MFFKASRKYSKHRWMIIFHFYIYQSRGVYKSKPLKFKFCKTFILLLFINCIGCLLLCRCHQKDTTCLLFTWKICAISADLSDFASAVFTLYWEKLKGPSRCFPVNFETFLWKPFLQNTCRRLLLNFKLRPKCLTKFNLVLSAFFYKNYVVPLTHFSPVSHFHVPWKRQKTKGFLKFSGGIEMWHWTKMG